MSVKAWEADKLAGWAATVCRGADSERKSVNIVRKVGELVAGCFCVFEFVLCQALIYTRDDGVVR